MAEPVIELSGVTKEYGKAVRTRVLHGIDLTLERGELTALIGPSGSGKSTLLHILGLLDRPTEGRIVMLGREVPPDDDDARTRLRGRVIGFVFQFHHLLPSLTALENVRLPMVVDARRVRPQFDERALQLLEDVGLADRARSRVDQLSGGQQQRVAVARALALDPPLVLADEPTGNLDTASSDAVFDLLRTVNRRGTAVLVVTHDPRIADRCRRVVELVDGRVVSDDRAGPR